MLGLMEENEHHLLPAKGRAAAVRATRAAMGDLAHWRDVRAMLRHMRREADNAVAAEDLAHAESVADQAVAALSGELADVVTREAGRWLGLGRHSGGDAEPAPPDDSEILHAAVKGQPRTEWVVGIAEDGVLARHEWDAGEPHLLLAGSPGGGQIGYLHSLARQLAHNNHPDDARLWFAASAASELMAYRRLAHVDYYIETTDGFTALLQEAISETHRRYTAFGDHPRRPQNLADARAIAARDPEGSGHLAYPRIFLIVEEAGAYFQVPEKWRTQIMPLAAKIGRESRAAGIHMVAATHYPADLGGLPDALTGNSKRVGLRCADASASRAVIEEPGLEAIQSGRAMIWRGGTDGGWVTIRGLHPSPSAIDGLPMSEHPAQGLDDRRRDLEMHR